MTEFYLDGPPVHRLRYLLDYCLQRQQLGVTSN